MLTVRFPFRIRPTAIRRRLIEYVDSNSDWLWMPFAALVAILLAAIFAMSI